MTNKILFIGGTHGDEPIGVVTLKQLGETRGDFDWIIGNPRALQQQTRYTERDLNRSAPGNMASLIYEEKRADEIIQKSQNYQYTVDIHGAKNDMGICILITNPTRENFALATQFNIQSIVIWPSITPEMQYPMSEFFPCGIEIECGDKTASQTMKQLTQILNDFLDGKIENTQQKNIYRMIGPLNKNEIEKNSILREFEEINLNNEKITPVFLGTYDYPEIIGYKLKKLSDEELKKYF